MFNFFNKFFGRKTATTQKNHEDHQKDMTSTATTASAENTVSKVIQLPNPAGLHARPAASLVKMAKSFPANITLALDGKSANVKSVVDLLSLGTYHKAMVTLVVSGENANEALKTLAAFIEAGSGENCDDSATQHDNTAQSNITQIGFSEADLAGLKPEQCFKGVAVSDGLAIGELFVLTHQTIQVSQKGQAPSVEIQLLNSALESAKSDLNQMIANTTQETQQAILVAHLGLLEDPNLLSVATETIQQQECSAAFAWKENIIQQKNKLLTGGNALLAERAQDLEDVGQRVLRILTGQKEVQLDLPARCILIAQQLTPSDTIKLDRNKVLGFATVEGGTTSHVAILARAMNLPALCAVDASVLNHHQKLAILETKSAQLIVEPDAALQAKTQVLLEALQTADHIAREQASQPAILKDGTKIDVVANVASVEDIKQALENGAEGVGLLRTEILFVNSTEEPSLALQTEMYSELARACGLDRILVLRTLDIGGDKPVPYLRLDNEENPFLGVRGLRLTLMYPDMFRTQIRAVLKASALTKMHIMLPMVTNIDEFMTAKAMIEEEKVALGITAHIPLGIMIEVPAAALLAHHFAPHVDFFSIGTNDLTQYTLAMDRGHAALAKQADAYHPSVLRLIHMTCQAANQHGKWVGVCGGLASDPNAVALLIGLGVKELSASGNSISHVKARVRDLNFVDCQSLAEKALAADSPQAVRALTQAALMSK